MSLKRTVTVAILGVLAVVAGCVLALHPPSGLVLYAQTVPSTVHAQWSQNAAGDNVLNYKVSLDGGAPLTVLPTLDATCACVQTPLVIPAFGSHTVSIVTVNLSVSTDPNSGQQSGAPTVVTFSLNQPPNGVSGGTVKR